MLDWFIPQTIEVVGNKTVVKDKGNYIVYVDGTEQSGPWVKKIWSKSLDQLHLLPSAEILVLGFGCGSLISLLPKDSKITGIEIDPEMVEIGKKYFSPRGKIIIADAINLPSEKFNLILVDVYQGYTFPKKFESPHFLQKLSQTVSKNGNVIFNRLTTKNANFELEKFVDKLQKYFTITSVKKVDFNTLIICSRRKKH